MLNTDRQLCRTVQGLAVLGLIATIVAIDLFGVGTGRTLSIVLGVAAVLLLALSFAGLRLLAHHRGFVLSEMQAGLLGAVAGGLLFVAALYHLSWLYRTFAEIHVAIDDLVPGWIEHLLALLPGIALFLAAEYVLRQPARPVQGGHHRHPTPRHPARRN